MRSFLIYRPDGSSVVVECTLPLIRIGRGDDNEIVLEDPSRSVSRFHAQLAADQAGPILTDMKSANGTFVNEQILDGPVMLAQDDVVRIGPYRLIFRDTYVATPTEKTPLRSQRLRIETSTFDLNELQASTRFLEPSVTQTLPRTPQFRALELLHEVGVRLARTVTVADVVETAADLLFRITGVQRATLMSWDDEQQAFRPAELYGRGGEKDDRLRRAVIILDPRKRRPQQNDSRESA